MSYESDFPILESYSSTLKSAAGIKQGDKKKRNVPKNKMLQRDSLEDSNDIPIHVVYLTENLLKKICKDVPFAQIQSLHFPTLISEKIGKIENLERFIGLKELDLEKQNIVKIEGLSSCTQLVSLNLASNKIRSISGLDALVHLRRLKLSDNQINRISDLSSLVSLEKISLDKNQLSMLKDIVGLKANIQLTTLDILYGNVELSLPHAREYIIHTLPQLLSLDGDAIKASDRKNAEELFHGTLFLYVY